MTSPPSPADDDVRQWLGELVERQIEERFTAFLDLGGGDEVLKVWSRELDLAPFLEKYGITPVALHFLGCEVDDLSYLRDIEAVLGSGQTARCWSSTKEWSRPGEWRGLRSNRS